MRRRIATALGVAALAAVPVALTGAGPATAAPDNASQFCSQYNDLWFSSHGDCVSTFRSSSDAASFCRDYGQYWFGSVGQCVSSYNQYKNSL